VAGGKAVSGKAHRERDALATWTEFTVISSFSAIGPDSLAVITNRVVGFATLSDSWVNYKRMPSLHEWMQVERRLGRGFGAVDPDVIYDVNNHRFIATALVQHGADCNDATRQSYIFMRISETNDATGAWANPIKIDVTALEGQNWWADFPRVGVNAQGIYVTATIVPWGQCSGETHAAMFVYTVDKVPVGPVKHFKWPGTDSRADRVIAAVEEDAAANEYLVGTFSNNQIALYRVKWCKPYPLCGWRVAGASAYVSSTFKNHQTQAGQPSSAYDLDVPSTSLVQASYARGHVYTSQTVNNVVNGAQFSTVRAYRVDPVSYKLFDQWVFGANAYTHVWTDSPGWYYDAAITANRHGGQTMVYLTSRESKDGDGCCYLSIGYVNHSGDTFSTGWSDPHNLIGGHTALLTPYDSGRSAVRVGDMCSVAPAPQTANTFIFCEYAGYQNIALTAGAKKYVS